jgi:hypothetical protein
VVDLVRTNRLLERLRLDNKESENNLQSKHILLPIQESHPGPYYRRCLPAKNWLVKTDVFPRHNSIDTRPPGVKRYFKILIIMIIRKGNSLINALAMRAITPKLSYTASHCLSLTALKAPVTFP